MSAHFLRITLRWLTMTTTYFDENALVAEQKKCRKERARWCFERISLFHIALPFIIRTSSSNPPKFGHFRFLFTVLLLLWLVRDTSNNKTSDPSSQLLLRLLLLLLLAVSLLFSSLTMFILLCIVCTVYSWICSRLLLYFTVNLNVKIWAKRERESFIRGNHRLTLMKTIWWVGWWASRLVVKISKSNTQTSERQR